MNEKGELKKMGEVVKPAKLCETLKIIAEKGADEFYKGELAKIIVKDLQEAGSIITEEDLAEYT